MPLRNRVTPLGDIVAVAARGNLMGNRGRIHDPASRQLRPRRWAGRRWICCLTEFKGRRRAVMGVGYTELFFLDEPTALAAGHRPCFECRRAAARVFADAWATAFSLAAPPGADTIDSTLHAERLDRNRWRYHRAPIDRLPDGAAILAPQDGAPAMLRGNALLAWSHSGYSRQARPRGIDVTLLTPPATIAVLAAGYAPAWHASAG